ncbi:porphobilinogen deaminase, dipyromethane cofactor binding domain-containing protein [Sphaerosporella brunnea]|uniref:Porphobilinogen deaminase n=1 Tax=Sphaerosporella brunnea TaxID=1250544 RepID=A0A5J5FBB5_9PEZI|nr:porphobilinogen deaminase, dipyromethane cofactor binding domain-containing protein [Sphaerosporella brunnea]
MLSYLIAYLYAAIMSRLSAGQRPRSIVLGTRSSVLAMAQTEIVRQHLLAAFPDLEITIEAIKTAGDKNLVVPLHQMEAKSLWTQELEVLLWEHKVDVVVHSLKDMPTQLPPSCHLAAILEREDPRDAFVARAGKPYTCLANLPAGAIVGSSSVRRMAQVQRLFPHITLVDCRGNVPSRLRKLDGEDPNCAIDYDALILASAGLLRLGLGHRITQYLDAPEVLHAVGQGAIGIETRDGDEKVMELLAASGMNHGPTAKACWAERSLLRTLEGGCSVPIGVKTSWESDGQLRMLARVSSVDGAQVVEADECAAVSNQEEAETFGRAVAQKLVELGATPILKKIEADKLAKEAEKRESAAQAAARASQADEAEQESESVVLVEQMEESIVHA